MRGPIAVLVINAALSASTCSGQEFGSFLDHAPAHQPAVVPSHTFTSLRGQSPGGGAEGGAGAAEATDPSAILTQMQFQNVFTPETYDASGYSNKFILQPVLPFPVAAPMLKELFPNHIMRPTLPITIIDRVMRSTSERLTVEQ